MAKPLIFLDKGIPSSDTTEFISIPAPVSRSDGERIRVRHHLRTLRAMLESVEIALRAERHAPDPGLAQAVVSESYNLAAALVRLDAYTFAEIDASEKP